MANPCLDGSGVDANFTAPELDAQNCQLSLKLPTINLKLLLPFGFPPLFDFSFNFNLVLSCDLSKPIDVAGGVKFGGGRVPCFDADPDLDYDT